MRKSGNPTDGLRPQVNSYGTGRLARLHSVASVIVPRPDRLYLPSLEELAFTLVNPSIKCFRQAMAIDERRSMFRVKRWEEPQIFAHNRFNQAGAEPQDCKQVWFAGVHGDIGGSYPESSGALSKYPLLWMLAEAAACGLAFNPESIHQLAWGVQRRGSPYSYVAPDVAGELHNSMNWSWRLLEYIPKPDKYKEWPQRRSRFGHYIPDAEPRLIGEGAFIHKLAAERMAAVAIVGRSIGRGHIKRCVCRKSHRVSRAQTGARPPRRVAAEPARPSSRH